MAVTSRVLLASSLAIALCGCGSKDADTDSSTTGLKAPLPAAKPGSVVDPPDPSKDMKMSGDLPGGGPEKK